MVATKERHEGTLATWNDDRGFGFISAASKGDRIFAHISAFSAQSPRPVVGERLSFDVVVGPDGKRRAERIRMAGGTSVGGRRTPGRTAGASGTGSRPKFAAGSVLTLVAFVVLYLIVNVAWPIPLWVAGLYGVMSVISFVVYALDKSAAQAGRWRISESTLLLLGAVCGWPGALVAQQALRHKTQKRSFRTAFWGSVAANVLVFVVFATPLFARFAELANR